MPLMTRSAPTLGLATATVMITMIGAAAIRYASHPGGRVTYAEALSGGLRQSSPASHAAAPSATPSSRDAMPRPTVRAPGSSQPAPRPSRPAPSSASNPASGRLLRSPSAAPKSAISAVGATTLSSSANLSYAKAVFQAVNQARAGQHLPPLAWSPQLQQSAHQHNLAMAAANTLAHQVGDEPSLGARETAAGVPWHFAAENIGWTTAQNRSGALGIEASMFAETAPSDAHRLNILSTSAHAIGIDVLIDATHGRLWLTEDFADVR
jgi:uncharacterized protein YkwD